MNDKELIEKLNNRVKKIPVKIIEKNILEDKNVLSSKCECLGDCHECECEFNNDDFRRNPQVKIKEEFKPTEKELINKLNKQVEERSKEEKTPITEEDFNKNIRDISSVDNELIDNNLNNDDNYRIFDFNKSKEIIHKLDNIPSFKYKEKPIKELYECDGKTEQFYTVEDILKRINKSIKGRDKQKNQKAYDVWKFIHNTVIPMEKTMESIEKDNNCAITINDLERIFNKFINVWTALYNAI